jgi:hypothetical protein
MRYGYEAGVKGAGTMTEVIHTTPAPRIAPLFITPLIAYAQPLSSGDKRARAYNALALTRARR